VLLGGSSGDVDDVREANGSYRIVGSGDDD
jgi:hypothetical protein